MNLEEKEIFRSAAILVLSAIIVFFSAQTVLNGQNSNIESMELGYEVNSTNEISQVNFYNQSFELILENSENASFYIDRNKDGAADEKLDTVSDGEIRQATILSDSRSEVYRIYMRYQDDGSVSDDAWMQVYRVEKLG